MCTRDFMCKNIRLKIFKKYNNFYHAIYPDFTLNFVRATDKLILFNIFFFGISHKKQQQG